MRITAGALLLVALLLCGGLSAQESERVYSLEEFRRMALEGSKSLNIAREKINVARESRKAAFAYFLPDISAQGTYMWNEKSISLLEHDALLPVGSLNAEGRLDFHPNEFAYLPKSSMEYDIHNVFAGGIGFTQPLFMGFKVREMYNLSKKRERIAELEMEELERDLLIEVDEAYWRTVSLLNKRELALSFVELLTKLERNVAEMLAQGVATKGDLLKVKVRLNEANLALTKAENGLQLSKMALAQLCGLELRSKFSLEDQDVESLPSLSAQNNGFDLSAVLSRRPELKRLDQMIEMTESNIKMQRGKFFPSVALSANYLVSNPNSYNGFKNKFAGAFSAGVVLKVPIFHFGERVHSLRAAKHAKLMAEYAKREAEEKIELQVSQSSFKLGEAQKRLAAAISNIESAAENLRLADAACLEGVAAVTDLLAAQTAWVSAKSERIDAAIEVKMCSSYLLRAKGESLMSEE